MKFMIYFILKNDNHKILDYFSLLYKTIDSTINEKTAIFEKQIFRILDHI
jgi:hypothetical protein